MLWQSSSSGLSTPSSSIFNRQMWEIPKKTNQYLLEEDVDDSDLEDGDSTMDGEFPIPSSCSRQVLDRSHLRPLSPVPPRTLLCLEYKELWIEVDQSDRNIVVTGESGLGELLQPG
ncbi:hypothetical protein SCP_1000500 [Sparassis crispa]|uniref:Uncharacterized protein n=1 Tax=Sparassis crispa TaxID=139825 RepID=A0A401GX45_9APHY|nr:hypothetical protein SCP_1000500 [Sparassis crispa]GBE86808.1 hypothetical protein SCP_1000500 [Sparassis crispa]